MKSKAMPERDYYYIQSSKDKMYPSKGVYATASPQKLYELVMVYRQRGYRASFEHRQQEAEDYATQRRDFEYQQYAATHQEDNGGPKRGSDG